MKPATLFIFISMIIDAMGWGPMIPGAPMLVSAVLLTAEGALFALAMRRLRTVEG